jgi:hypothetical protein
MLASTQRIVVAPVRSICPTYGAWRGCCHAVRIQKLLDVPKSDCPINATKVRLFVSAADIPEDDRKRCCLLIFVWLLMGLFLDEFQQGEAIISAFLYP